MNPHRQLEEALSWRLVTELWRRFPDRCVLVLIETQPAGGQYDGLTLTTLRTAFSYWFFKKAEPLVCLDTDGRLHTIDGAVHNLVTLYDRHHRIWPVIAETSLKLLP